MRVKIHFSIGFFPLLFSSLITLCLAGCAEDNSILNNGGNKELKFSVKTYDWNNSNSSFPDSKPDSRATPISGNTFDTSKNFNVIADENKGDIWSTEVNKETAFYSTVNKIWQTTAAHYWPGAGSTADFYAYYPTSISGSITHTPGSAPILAYTVPDDAASQTDILAASSPDVSYSTGTAIPLAFSHIFAAVQFSVGTAGLPEGTISSITINGIKNSGTYTFGNGWTLNSRVTTFKVFPSIVISGTSGESITTGTYTFLMIPQTFSNAVITLTYSNGTTFSTVISGTWTAGNAYTYQLSKSVVYNFNYTGDTQTFTAPYTGTYKIQCWGSCGNTPCTGSYTSGYLYVKKKTELYIYVGSVGCRSNTSLTYPVVFNGGGGFTSGCADFNNCTGGGATDIRLSSGNWNDFSSLKSRIMVAAGGGGSGSPSLPGYGGDLTSKTADGAYPPERWPASYSQASGVSQTSGYSFGTAQSSLRAGGGGGYYGGYAENCAGSGGSSFISGYSGCDAISESSTSTNIIHTGSPDHYSGYVFTNMEMIAGNSSMPSPSGGTETGHTGNGYARITFVSAN
jgi:hypothetical protein